MIKELTMYTVVCDNCAIDCNEGEEYSGWSEEWYAEEIADNCGWLKQDDCHYCEPCWNYDDDDNIIINKARQQNDT